MFKKIVIAGVGLIGGSVGLAVRKRKIAREIVGLCRREISCRKAVASGAVHTATMDVRKAVKGAGLIIISTPISRIAGIAKEAAKYADKGTIITDAGSTKKDVIKAIGDMPSGVHFVGSHPMAGSEKTGVSNAYPALFEKSVCVVTRTVKTDGRAFLTVKKFWKSLGADVKVLSPDEHDELVAFISHLPHAVSFALSRTAENKSLVFAANSFRDMTRVAASDPVLWHDIFMTNKKNLLSAVKRFKRNLSDMENSIRKNDSKKLLKLIEEARSKRLLLNNKKYD